MSKFWIGNFCLFLSILCAVASQIMLKALLNEIGAFRLDWPSLQVLFVSERAARIYIVVAVLIVGFFLWVMSLSRLDISYAYPIASASALLVTFFSVLFLNEAVSPRMWLGTALIVLGTILVAPHR